MEKLSNQNKKELFMSMVEKSKNGTLDMMRMTESKKYDEIYSQLGNNNGPFGLVINGITKDGKISFYLAESLEKQLPSDMGDNVTLEIEESDLDDFLDRFFEMNNMEILNEFYKNEPDYFKNIGLEEYKSDVHNSYYDRLAILNGLDYLSSQGLGTVLVNGRDNYVFENGLYVFLDGENGQILISKDNENMSYDIRNNQIENQTEHFEGSECEQYTSTLLKSIRDLPRVYESIISGKYEKEDFVPAKAQSKEKSTLQQKEEELSSLESEEKKISEAEALIEQQKEGQDIGE